MFSSVLLYYNCYNITIDTIYIGYYILFWFILISQKSFHEKSLIRVAEVFSAHRKRLFYKIWKLNCRIPVPKPSTRIRMAAVTTVKINLNSKGNYSL